MSHPVSPPAVQVPRPSVLPPGLSQAEAQRRLQESGPNVIPSAAHAPLYRVFLAQFKSPLVIILLAAMLIESGLWLASGSSGGRPAELLAMAAILLLNAGLGTWQEFKSDRTMDRLRALTLPLVNVLRDGDLVRMPSTGIVPGDMVRMIAGDRVPADGQWAGGVSLAVDESLVTGESMPVDRVAGDPVLSGTLLVRGSGWINVTATGARSRLGSLATLLGKLDEPPTRLQQTITAWGRQMATAVVILTVLILLLGVVRLPVDEWSSLLVFALALAVAAVPEGLPLVMTLAMALGMERMAGRKAVVRRLQAVEALGGITVIATDKTGTLTLNRQTVVDGVSPRPDALLEAMVLCNDAPWGDSDLREPSAVVAGDPLEHALLRYAADHGVSPGSLRSQHPVLSSRPFDAAWKYMRVTCRHAARGVSWLKGAPEVLMERCRLTSGERDSLRSMISRRAAEGLRALAFARGDGDAESGLEWLGVVFLLDPPREEVPAAISSAKAAGIRVIMMTGDHAATAEAMARRIGIDATRVCEGAWLDSMNDEALSALVMRCSVFARVLPEHKLRLVRLLQSNGERVAVTGDGVNDAPALKAADVGVAMGLRGSDVSREAADIVLLDDNFASLVAAIEEGRNIYLNIVRFVRLLLAANLAEVLVITVAAVAGLLGGGHWLAPFTALQILWINVLTDSFPAFAIALDRDQRVMERPPLARDAPLLDDASWRFVGLASLAVATVCLLLLSGVLPGGSSGSQTLAFAFLMLVQLVLVWPARRLGSRPLANRWLAFSVAAVATAQMLAMLWPPARELLGLQTLQADQWGLLLLLVSLACVVSAMAGNHRKTEGGG